MRRILGIDPGSRVTGFAVIEVHRSGVITPRDLKIIEVSACSFDKSMPLTDRVGLLHRACVAFIAEQKPTEFVIEDAYFGVNPQSSLKLGMVRGALIAAASFHQIPIFQLTPASVKKCITGSGRAEKEEIARCLEALVKFKRGDLPYDATDALAIAIAYSLQPLAPKRGFYGNKTKPLAEKTGVM